MGHTLLCVLSLFLLNTLLCGKAEVRSLTNKVSVTLQPNWPEIYRGESITVRCEIQGGGDTEWTYEWRTPRGKKASSLSEYRISGTTESDTGDYSCRGRRDFSFTEWSQTKRLTVSRKPKAALTADRTVIAAGGSGTLTCSVDGSNSWKYKWFRRTSGSSKPVRETDQPQTVIRQGGYYTCRGVRGQPEFLTEESYSFTMKETVSNKVSVTLQPNWPEIYRGERITVRCEIQGGGDTEWTYEWRPPRENKASSLSEYRISGATESDTGDYSCRGRRDFSYTEWSQTKRLTVSPNKPRASLRADSTVIPAGGQVTLTCSVSSSSGWKYNWYRDDKSSEPLNTRDGVFQTTGTISVSQEGVYWCRGGRGDPVYYTDYSQSVSIYNIVPNRAVVSLQPNWPEIFRGERITVSCEIQGGGDTEWTYEWRTPSSSRPLNQHEHRISSASPSDSGDYRCKGRMKSSTHNTTEWSDSVKLTVNYNGLRPVVTVSPSWLSPGASVTLKCQVEHPSAGWRFFWYKTVPELSDNSYSYELLPGSSNGTEQDSYIIHGQTHTAGYVCRAGRGDPVYYTQYSDAKFVWSGDIHPSASLTVSPDRVQHFTYDDISLSCEGNSTEWRVRRFPEGGPVSHCPEWRRMTGSTCQMYPTHPHHAVYWCESGSRDFSNSANITVQDYSGIILTSPVHPVTEGESVILGCRTQSQLSSVIFYHNDKLIQNDTRTELNISAVSKSDEGFYKCQSSGKMSPQSWMSVKAVQRRESSSFPLSLIVGLICGVVLVVLLLLLYRYRQSKELCFIRPTQSESTSFNTYHEANQNGSQCNEYNSLNCDAGVYETIKDSENAESQDVTYSAIELKNVGKKGKHCKPAETSVYSDLKIGTAVKSAPAATDYPIYSEVQKSGTASGL